MDVISFGNKIGTVELLAWLGSDALIAQTARVSTGAASKGDAADAKLIEYLVKNKHTSPLEFGEMMWEVTAPIYVSREWFRHRIGEYSEKSQRYAEVGDGDYAIPYLWRTQSKLNRQASEGPIEMTEDLIGMVKDAIDNCFSVYEKLIARGVAREQARVVLPLCTLTTFRVKYNVHSIMHFCALRTSSKAQPEIKAFADLIEADFAEKFPICHSAYLKHYKWGYES